jgi:hypothetical protein
MSTAFARAYAAAFTGKTNGSECVMRGYDCPICGKHGTVDEERRLEPLCVPRSAAQNQDRRGAAP